VESASSPLGRVLEGPAYCNRAVIFPDFCTGQMDNRTERLSASTAALHTGKVGFAAASRLGV